MRTLAVVPARGGSKGLPGKNAKPFLGEPLLGRAIRIGLETCERTVVTTDDPALGLIAMGYDPAVVHLRPVELAQDDTPMAPVVQDAIKGLEGDVIVLLQPTQPLRTANQVRKAIALLEDGWDSVVSVRRVPPQYWADRQMVESPFGLRRVDYYHGDRRQDAREGFARDGTVYVTRRDVVRYCGSLYGLKCRPFILEGDALSIDTLEDFERLEAMASA